MSNEQDLILRRFDATPHVELTMIIIIDNYHRWSWGIVASHLMTVNLFTDLQWAVAGKLPSTSLISGAV